MVTTYNMINTDAYVFVLKKSAKKLYSFSVRVSFDGIIRKAAPKHQSFIGMHIDELIERKSAYYDYTKID